MRLDDALKLGSSQAVTDTDAYMTNVILDHGNVTPKRDPYAGEPMCLVFQVGVAAAGSTDTTDFIAVQSANSNLSSHTEVAKRRIANALLTAGSLHIVPLPPGVQTTRYGGGRVELGSGDTVTVSCWLAPLKDVQQYDRYYAPGSVIA
jgi:hypothetical protein